MESNIIKFYKFMNKKVMQVKSPNSFIAYKLFNASRISILLAKEIWWIYILLKTYYPVFYFIG